jgi:hypothetical protein
MGMMSRLGLEVNTNISLSKSVNWSIQKYNLHAKDSGYYMSTTIASVTWLITLMVDKPHLHTLFVYKHHRQTTKVVQSNDINL